MAEDGKAIKALYDEGMFEVQRVLFSLDSTATQRKAARLALRDLTAMLLAHTVKTVEGRTALLTGLIVELGEVIEKVKVKPPFQDALNKLSGALAKGHKLLAEQKKKLIE